MQVVQCVIQISCTLIESIKPFAWGCQCPRHILSLTWLELRVENLQRCQCFWQLYVCRGIIWEVEDIKSPILWSLDSFHFHQRYTTSLHSSWLALNIIIVVQNFILVIAKIWRISQARLRRLTIIAKLSEIVHC